MKAYITGKGLVSAIGFGNKALELPEVSSWYAAEKPDFTKYFNANQARRTSNILKMGLVAALDALRNDTSNIDGIMVATGLGCITDSEKFLVNLIQFDETLLSPTPFIQSTHNTIAGSIALHLKIHSYNFTYSERIFSFEWTLLDALMQISENQKNSRFLVGSSEEITERTFKIAQELKIYQEFDANFADIKNIKSNRVFVGEHAAFFTLDKVAQEGTLSLEFVKMYFQQSSKYIITDLLKNLEEKGLTQPDCILVGINGHQVFDKIYDPYFEAFADSNFAYFKHLSGENLTMSSFAFWLATEIVENQDLPEIVCYKQVNQKLNNVLIINHLKRDYLSAIFVSK